MATAIANVAADPALVASYNANIVNKQNILLTVAGKKMASAAAA
jgi:hypothetical protein